MESTEKSYENLMRFLKNSEPQLEQADELRKNILKRIEYQSINKQKRTIYRFTAILSGAAACFLGILFVYETARWQTACHSEPSAVRLQTSIATREFVQNSSFHPTNYAENLKIIASLMQQKQIENKKQERLYAALLDRIN